MITFALRALSQRKLRTMLTGFAIVLGVAMVSGTFVLTDSISNAFDSIFSDSYRNTDAVITGKVAVDSSNGPSTAASFDESLLTKVRATQEVGAAAPVVNGTAQLIGHDGKAISFGGAPNIGFNVNPDQPAFQTVDLVSGSWPGTGQVVIDASTASKKKFATGDSIGVLGVGAEQKFTISGIIRYGKVSTIGGATLAGFDLADAQHLLGKVGKLDQILIAAKKGVSPKGLQDALASKLPKQTQILSADEQAAQDSKSTNEFLNFFKNFLLVFAGVALFVGSFVIANSLSITIAQRTREFATLRTLGATRRQVLGSVIVEAVVTGVAAALTGLGLGVLLAKGLFWIFDHAGLTLPNSGLLFRPRTAIASLLVGVLVTLVASLRPALRATRVPPIAAVREGATLPPTRFARFRTPGALAAIVIGFGLLATGLFKKGLDTTPLLLLLMSGALVVFIGVSAFSAHLIAPMAGALNPVARIAIFVFSLLVWPFFTLPYWAVRKGLSRWKPDWADEFPSPMTERSVVQIGGENSRRDPRRTASTAGALMIGLALVTLVATLAAGIIKPFESAVDRIFTADYAVVASSFGGSGLPLSVTDAVRSAPGIDAVVGVRFGDGKVSKKTLTVSAVDPRADRVIALDWAAGDQSLLATLPPDAAIVDDAFAKAHSLSPGSDIELTVPNGDVVPLTVRGIFKPPDGGSPFGRVTIAAATFDLHYQQPTNGFDFVKISGGATAANTKALNDALTGFPNAKVQTRKQFKADQIRGISGLLNVLYVLLALSVLVSIFGIVNTLVLTVFERTREIGMIRAIGMTRRQTRRLIRHESVVIALIGAVLGIALGLVFAALLVARLDALAWALPVGQLVTFAALSVLVGIFAAIFPARRAARLNPLEALKYE